MSHRLALWSLALAPLLATALAAPPVASAMTFTVNDATDLPRHPSAAGCECRVDPRGSRCTLRAAVQAANDCPGHDTISLAASGPYVLTQTGAGEDFAVTGDLDLHEGVTIEGNGEQVRAGGDRVFDVWAPAGQLVELYQLRVTDGHADYGGALRSRSCDLGLDNVTFDQNVADQAGGAIWMNGGGLTAVDSLFVGNRAIVDGGGGAVLSVDRTSSLDGVRFEGNEAGYMAGGVHIWPLGGATAALSSCELVANRAPRGGGALIAYGVEVSHSTFEDNAASLRGGGVYLEGDAVVRQSTFRANEAREGGGVFGGGVVRASTFVINEAARGGAIAHGEQDMEVSNSTFYRNSARAGGAISHTADGGTLRGAHNTFASNGASVTGRAVYSPQAELYSSIFSSTQSGVSLCTYPVSQGYSVGTDGSCLAQTSDLQVTSAGVGALGSNGGPTQTIPLLPGSPAIDAADPAQCLPTDQRGSPRPSGPGCDVGAFEL